MSVDPIRLRLLDPEHYVDGLMAVEPNMLEWVPTPIVLDGTCQHDETVCDVCVQDWANDWEIHLDDLARLRELLDGRG